MLRRRGFLADPEDQKARLPQLDLEVLMDLMDQLHQKLPLGLSVLMDQIFPTGQMDQKDQKDR